MEKEQLEKLKIIFKDDYEEFVKIIAKIKSRNHKKVDRDRALRKVFMSLCVNFCEDLISGIRWGEYDEIEKQSLNSIKETEVKNE